MRAHSPKTSLKKHPLDWDFLAIWWNESPPQPAKHKQILILVLKFRSFNRELSPKSRLKKHPLDGDFLAMWGNASPPQPSKHKQILILFKIVWALQQRHCGLYANNFILSNIVFLHPPHPPCTLPEKGEGGGAGGGEGVEGGERVVEGVGWWRGRGGRGAGGGGGGGGGARASGKKKKFLIVMARASADGVALCLIMLDSFWMNFIKMLKGFWLEI